MGGGGTLGGGGAGGDSGSGAAAAAAVFMDKGGDHDDGVPKAGEAPARWTFILHLFVIGKLSAIYIVPV